MISFSVRLRSCWSLVLLIAPVAGFAQQKSGFNPTGLTASTGNLNSQPPTTTRISPELRGDIFMARKMYREAIDKYREAPETAVTANKIGIAFHILLQFDLAKKSYERALKLDPKYYEAENNIGTIYYAKKNYHRAIGYYKRALHLSGPAASVYANMGAAYFARKDYKHASSYYEQALRLDPDVFERHNGVGTLMQERTVTELALFHLALAKTYAKAGSNERALLYLRKALEEGIKDRNKIPSIPEFATLKKDPAFDQLLAENPKPL